MENNVFVLVLVCYRETMKIACIQITSRADMAENIRRVEALVAKAVAKGAEFVALPENVFLMSSSPSPLGGGRGGGIRRKASASAPLLTSPLQGEE